MESGTTLPDGNTLSLQVWILGLCNGGSSRFFFDDRMGTATKETDSARTVTATRTYDAFGSMVASSGSSPSPFGYAGGYGYQEDATGLKLLGHRYYDPTTGRFLTRDPIRDGSNWYEYCSNNPLRWVDPSGLTWFFDQRSGAIWWDDPSTADFDPVLKGFGYSGKKGWRDPSKQNKGSKGPLPRGKYHISPRKKTKRSNPKKPFDCFWIDQITGKDYGRSGFLIHKGGADDSEGCIVVDGSLMDSTEASNDPDLVVYDSGSSIFNLMFSGFLFGAPQPRWLLYPSVRPIPIIISPTDPHWQD